MPRPYIYHRKDKIGSSFRPFQPLGQPLHIDEIVSPMKYSLLSTHLLYNSMPRRYLLWKLAKSSS